MQALAQISVLILVPVVEFEIWFSCHLLAHQWVHYLEKESVFESGNHRHICKLALFWRGGRNINHVLVAEIVVI